MGLLGICTICVGVIIAYTVVYAFAKFMAWGLGDDE